MKVLLQMAGVLVLGLAGGRVGANSPEAPLPPVAVVIERVLARSQQESENDAVFKANYFFKRSKTTEHRNIRGHLTGRKEKVSVNEPAARPADEDRVAASGSGGTGGNGISSDASRHKREFVNHTNLVKRFAFALRGRELVAGRPTLVVEFKPAREKLPAADFKERCLSKMAGCVWVDEAEYVIVKVDARLTERIGVVGGLLGSVHHFDFSFGRERTEDGLWYTRLLKWHLQMRELIVDRVIDCVETRTDVRKLP